jgi:hypothetical protein
MITDGKLNQKAGTYRGKACKLVDPEQVREVLGRSETLSAAGKDSFVMDAQGNATLSRVVDRRVTSIEDIVEVCQIDLEKWTIVESTCNVWEGMVLRGRGTDDEKLEQPQMFQVKVRLVPNRTADTLQTTIDRIIERAPKLDLPSFTAPRATKSEGIALELGPYDHHFAAMIWGKETGWESWDTELQQQFWDYSVDKILQRTRHHKIDKVFLVLGNDLFHVDSPKMETFKGTRQDVDSRFAKMVDNVINMSIGTAVRLAKEVAPVEIKTVKGNHDPTAVTWLNRVLKWAFANTSHVEVDEGYSDRKLIEWGHNLIMLHHAESAVSMKKFRELSNIMAAEFPHQWGNSLFREVHTGHLHHEITLDHYGVMLRRLRTLSPSSAWASGEGYVGSQRGTEGFVLHKHEGVIETPRVNIPKGIKRVEDLT